MPEELNFQDMRPWYKKPWGMLVGLFGVLFAGFLTVFLYNFFTIYGAMKASDLGAIKTCDTCLSKTATESGRTDLAKIYAVAAPAMGSAGAKIQVVQFADFACPNSAEEAPIFREMALKYSDRVRFSFRFFPVNEAYPEGPQAALAALCAEEQGQFWKMHDILFAHYDALDKDSLYAYANDAGLDLTAFGSCLETSKYKVRLQKDVADGVAAGVPGTPTFFIDGVKIPGSIPKETLEKAIVGLIAERR